MDIEKKKKTTRRQKQEEEEKRIGNLKMPIMQNRKKTRTLNDQYVAIVQKKTGQNSDK